MIRRWMQTILIVLALLPLPSGGGAFAQSSLPPIWSVAWSSGGAYVAFGFDGGTVQVLNAAIGLVTATRQLSSLRISSLAWKPSEPVLAAGAFDGQIILWNPTTDEIIRLYDGDGAIDAITWDQSGYYLASANEDTIYGPYTVKIWDMRTRNVIQTFPCSSRIRDIAWSPYGNRLALAGDTVIVIDPKTGEQTAELNEHQWIASVDWNDNGSQLVSAGGSDDTVRVWDINTGQAVAVIPTELVLDAQFSPNGEMLAMSDGFQIRIVDILTLQNLEIMENASAAAEVVWSPNGTQVAYGTMAGQTHIVTVDLGKNPPSTWSVAWSSDGTSVAFGFDGGTVQLYDGDTHLISMTRQLSRERISSLAWKPSEPVLAAGAFDGQILLWNPTTDEVIHLYDGDSAVYALSWSPDGQYLASANEDTSYGPYTVKIWDMQTRKVIETFHFPAQFSSRIRDLAWSPAGNYLALAGETVTLIDTATWQQAAELNGHQGVMSVAWNTDGSRLVSTGSLDETVRIWDIETQQAIAVIPTDFGKDAQLSPDGKMLAIADRDKIRIVDVLTQQNLEVIDGASGTVDVAWSPDGTQIAYSDSDQAHFATVELDSAP